MWSLEGGALPAGGGRGDGRSAEGEVGPWDAVCSSERGETPCD